MFHKTFTVSLKLLCFGIYCFSIFTPAYSAEYKEFHRKDQIFLSIDDAAGTLFLNWVCTSEVPEPDYWYFRPTDPRKYAKFLVGGTTNLYLYIGNRSAGNANALTDKDSGEVALAGPLTKVMYQRFASANYFTFNEEAYDNAGKITLSRVLAQISLIGSSAALQSALNNCASIGKSFLANQKLLDIRRQQQQQQQQQQQNDLANKSYGTSAAKDLAESGNETSNDLLMVIIVFAGIIAVLFIVAKPRSRPEAKVDTNHSKSGSKNHSSRPQQSNQKGSPAPPAAHAPRKRPIPKQIQVEATGDASESKSPSDKNPNKGYSDPRNIEIEECSYCAGDGCVRCGGTGLDLGR